MILGASNHISTLNLNLNENFTFDRETLFKSAGENQPDSLCYFDTYSN